MTMSVLKHSTVNDTLTHYGMRSFPYVLRCVHHRVTSAGGHAYTSGGGYIIVIDVYLPIERESPIESALCGLGVAHHDPTCLGRDNRRYCYQLSAHFLFVEAHADEV